MKRLLTAAMCLIGLAVPGLVASMFLFGCCILPFHHVLHKVLPLCQMMGSVSAGEHDDHDHHPATPAEPDHSSQKQLSAAFWTELPASSTLVRSDDDQNVVAQLATSRASVRNVISMGAVRCDDDVGLQILLTSYLI